MTTPQDTPEWDTPPDEVTARRVLALIKTAIRVTATGTGTTVADAAVTVSGMIRGAAALVREDMAHERDARREGRPPGDAGTVRVGGDPQMRAGRSAVLTIRGAGPGRHHLSISEVGARGGRRTAGLVLMTDEDRHAVLRALGGTP